MAIIALNRQEQRQGRSPTACDVKRYRGFSVPHISRFPSVLILQNRCLCTKGERRFAAAGPYWRPWFQVPRWIRCQAWGHARSPRPWTRRSSGRARPRWRGPCVPACAPAGSAAPGSAVNRVEHVSVGTQIGELVATLLLCDQHPVEPGEALGVHFPLQAPRHLLFGLPAQLQRNDLARPLADAVGDVVAGDVERLAVPPPQGAAGPFERTSGRPRESRPRQTRSRSCARRDRERECCRSGVAVRAT